MVVRTQIGIGYSISKKEDLAGLAYRWLVPLECDDIGVEISG